MCSEFHGASLKRCWSEVKLFTGWLDRAGPPPSHDPTEVVPVTAASVRRPLHIDVQSAQKSHGCVLVGEDRIVTEDVDGGSDDMTPRLGERPFEKFDLGREPWDSVRETFNQLLRHPSRFELQEIPPDTLHLSPAGPLPCPRTDGKEQDVCFDECLAASLDALPAILVDDHAPEVRKPSVDPSPHVPRP